MDVKLADVDDCHTKHYIHYNVDNVKKLKMIEGRHYKMLDIDGQPDGIDLLTVDDTSKNSTLIGKTIALRSPITCACKTGVCRTCYGKALAKINKNYNIGITAVNYLTNPLTQMLLSAKHLLSTNTDKIEWGDDFDAAFVTNLNTISFNDIDVSLIINKADIQLDDDEMSCIEKFKFVLNYEKSKRVIPYTSTVKLVLDPVLLEMIEAEDSDEVEIVSGNYPEGSQLFTFSAHNNELSKSLQQILDLIETTGHLGITDMHEFANKFADLLIENKLDYINSVHMELISSVLIKDAETNKRIDFTQNHIPEYKIVRVSRSILSGPLAKSLAFERITDQLMNIDTYSKDEESILDSLYD